MDEFYRVLKNLYEENPCQTLPNALWKTKERLSSLQCSYTGTLGNVVELRAWDREGLHIFWNQDREVDETFQQIVEKSGFMLLHDDYVQQVNVEGYNVIKPFFSLKYDNETVPAFSLPNGFCIKETDPDRESSQISDLIARCYKDLKPSPDVVRSWTSHDVFDPTLWIWIMDKHTNVPAALGIAEFDPTVSEGALEWIQVLPDYQGRGLGKVLVLELLNRLKGKANFTTVSGEVDNATNPERLYRSCGFVGNDTWWLLRRS